MIWQSYDSIRRLRDTIRPGPLVCRVIPTQRQTQYQSPGMGVKLGLPHYQLIHYECTRTRCLGK